MKLPWQKEEVKSASSMMVALSQLGSARWGGRSGGALMRDGYLRNAVAYRCVRMISEAAASVPFVTTHEGAQALLGRPLPDETCTDIFAKIYAHLQISGNAYLEALALGEGEAPRGLQVLRPERMKAQLDGRGWVSGWIYSVDRRARVIDRGETGWLPVLHLKLFHPGDDTYGLSPFAAARQALDLHNAGADWAKALIDNSAKPSGALVYGRDGARLTDEQFDRLKNELETAHSGAENAGRPLLLEGGLDWKPMSLSPAEMDFREARNGAAREISLALGVPPQLLGIPGDNTYANYKEANLAFWRMAIVPLVQRTADGLGLWLSEAFEEPVEVGCNLDAVPALSQERERLWARLEATSFLSDAEKRTMAGLLPEAPEPAGVVTETVVETVTEAAADPGRDPDDDFEDLLDPTIETVTETITTTVSESAI